LVLSAPLQLDLAFGLERDLKPELALQAYNNFKLHYPEHSEAPFALLRAANLYWNTVSDLEMANNCYQQLVDRYPDDAWVDFAREQMRVLSGRLKTGRP
jgi:outer membrane protein assembly factor BamD (BamD/ComL family)